MQNEPEVRTAASVGTEVFRHASSIGGRIDSDVTELAVIPNDGPRVGSSPR